MSAPEQYSNDLGSIAVNVWEILSALELKYVKVTSMLSFSFCIS